MMMDSYGNDEVTSTRHVKDGTTDEVSGFCDACVYSQDLKFVNMEAL